MKAKVSIILPAYNLEHYIERALDSILVQTYSNFELIVVDDGSTDKTPGILDAYAARDKRIRIIHTLNQGAPIARNLALDEASGKYVQFFDGDDFAEPNMLADEVSFAENNNLELVITGFYIDTYYDKVNHLTEIKQAEGAVYTTLQEFRENAYKLFDKNLLYVPWNKLFLRERIEELELRFINTFWDDFPFVLDYIRNVSRVGVLQEAYYHFERSRKDSETTRYRPEMYDKREEEHRWMQKLYSDWDLQNHEPSQEMLQRRYIERLIGCIENATNPSSGLKDGELRAHVKQMIDSPYVGVALDMAKPHSFMMKCMLIPIRMSSVSLTILEGKVISYVKRRNTRLFATLKAKR